MKQDNELIQRLKSVHRVILKDGLFTRYFAVFSAVIMVSFLLIGVFLLVFTADYWGSTKLQMLDENAVAVANLTTKSLKHSSDSERAAMVICNSLGQISQAIDADVFVCNTQGQIILCKDSLMPDLSVSSGGDCLFHTNYNLSEATLKTAADKGTTGFNTLDGIYAQAHAVAIEPIHIDGEVYGYVVATSPVMRELGSFSLRMLSMFLLAGAIALLITSIAVYIMADRFSKPLRQMASATRHYAKGDFTYRVQSRGNDELSRLIDDFNSMAEALAAQESSSRSFVANVSHEFKTPMTTIGGFINGILDGTVPKDKQDYYLSIVSSEVSRLSRLVTTMLNVSRIETGNVELRLTQYDISESVFDTFCGFEGIISDKKINVEGLDKIAPMIVNADADMFGQVIYNLVDNAVKFTEAGGTISVSASQSVSQAVLHIRNTGAGIPAGDIGRVFERFYKVDKSRSTDVKSVGLGLHLVKSIIELHAGTIKAVSVPGKYTEFIVTVPKTAE